MRFEPKALEVGLSCGIAFGDVSGRRLDFFGDDAREARALLRYVVRVTKCVNDFVRQVRYRRKPDESCHDEKKNEHPESNTENPPDAVVSDRRADSHGCPASSTGAGRAATRAPPDVSCPETTCATRNPIPMGSPLSLK